MISNKLDELQPLTFGKITKLMEELYEKKNHDYGNAFAESMDEEGITAARIRIGDKFRRFRNLTKDKMSLIKDESIDDTLIDMANYCIMTILWRYDPKIPE